MSATLDVKLTVRPDGPEFESWFIERAECDAQDSVRINSAAIEGTSAEMLALADAIERHDDYEGKCCACHWSDEGVDLWSPRNSHIATLVRHDRAAGLVETIRREVRP